jgi:serine protease Do
MPDWNGQGPLPTGDTMSLHLHDYHPGKKRFGANGRAALFLCVPACLVLLLAAAGRAETPGSRRTPIVEVVDRVKGAVVNIHSERTVKSAAADEFSPGAPLSRVNGMGTGIVIDPRGYIVTNQHVVEDVNLLRIRLADGGSYNAKVVARDQEADLALLKIEVGRPLPVIAFGTAQDLMVGETVVAVGNAYGYEHTVSSGIVSALKRDVSLNKEISYKSLIQTTASINPGNSGGPLLNINGELVGVNTAIRAGAQQIAFAIPVDTMLRVAADMISARRRGGLTHGIVYRDRIDTSQGALVRALMVERVDGPAAQAGVQRGDTILQVADQRVSCGLELERALLDHVSGDRLPLTVRRNGAETRLELVLQAVEHGQSAPAELVWHKMGLRLNAVNAETVSRYNAHLHGGLAVVDVNADSPAGKAGIQRGDILVGLHQWETVTLDNVAFVLTHPDLASFNPLRFYIIRAGQVHRGWLQQVD